MTVYDDTSDAPIVVNEGESVREVGLMHCAVNNSQKAPLSLLTFDHLGVGTPADADCTGC